MESSRATPDRLNKNCQLVSFMVIENIALIHGFVRYEHKTVKPAKKTLDPLKSGLFREVTLIIDMNIKQ